MNDRDRLVGQVRLRVERLDGRVVPLRDLAGEDLADRLGVEVQAAADALDVVGHRDRAEHERDVQDRPALGAGELRVGHRHVAVTEVDGLRVDLRDAAAGADGLVGDVDALLGVRGRPHRVDRRGQRRAGSAQLSRTAPARGLTGFGIVGAKRVQLRAHCTGVARRLGGRGRLRRPHARRGQQRDECARGQYGLPENHLFLREAVRRSQGCARARHRRAWPTYRRPLGRGETMW